LCQPACKPGSVWPRRLAGAATWRPFILGARCRAPHATYPDGGPETAPRVASLAIPIRSCSRCGLPCRFPLPEARWALTPPFHPYPPPRLAPLRRGKPHGACCDGARRPKAGGLLSVALSLGSPPPDVIRHRVSMEPGLSSSAAFRLSRLRPPGRLALRIKGFPRKNASPPERHPDRRSAQQGLPTFRKRSRPKLTS
jgi:hypothetical protein